MNPLLSLHFHTPNGGNMNYKIITMKDRFFSGKFDPEKLETMLNSYAGEGWKLSGVTTAEIPGALGQKREEIIFILERA
jgi:Domain of unknown function (DUF4177)